MVVCNRAGEELAERAIAGERKKRARREGERRGALYIHETNSYLKDVVAQCKVGEAIPGTSGALVGISPSLPKGFAAVVELRHAGG